MTYPPRQNPPPAWQPPPPRQVRGARKLKIAGIGCGGLFLFFLVIGIIGSIVAPAKTPAADARPAATASPSPTSAATTSTSPSPSTGVATVPALTGVTVDVAFATAARQGYATTATLRSGAALPEGALSDFLVCTQTPDSGTPATSDDIKLTVADTTAGETCTGQTYSPTPTPTPTQSPTVKPKPKPKPKPRPKPTHSPTHASTSGGSSGGAASDPGNGATALCNDGTYSYAAHHQGACSHHHGVAVFYK